MPLSLLLLSASTCSLIASMCMSDFAVTTLDITIHKELTSTQTSHFEPLYYHLHVPHHPTIASPFQPPIQLYNYLRDLFIVNNFRVLDSSYSDALPLHTVN